MCIVGNAVRVTWKRFCCLAAVHMFVAWQVQVFPILNHTNVLPVICSMASSPANLPQAEAVADASPIPPQDVTAEALRVAILQILQGKDLLAVSLKELRQQVSQKLGYNADAMEFRRSEIKKLAAGIVQAQLGAQGNALQLVDAVLQALLQHPEKADALQYVYLCTMSHTTGDCPMATETMPYKDLDHLDRRLVAEAVVDAFDNPLALGVAGGRPRDDEETRLKMVAVFRELHADGHVHFHVVIELLKPFRFKRAKRTLQLRHQLPSHFSSSHSLLWSALRYCVVETPKKPDVDELPWIWTPQYNGFAKDCPSVDLYELSQAPWRADSWRKRREDKERTASKKGAKVARFEKLDLTALMISKHLWSTDALLAYAQDHGSAAMQKYVHNHQAQLGQFIEHGKEWAAARDNATFEATDDWTLVCQCAEKACPHGVGACTYHQAAAQIFERNSATLSKQGLAEALRAILVEGPKKTNRVPFLIGPSNSGKSTLIYPFDDLFSPKRVLHKPALGSPFGLRSLAQNYCDAELCVLHEYNVRVMGASGKSV